MSLIPSDSVMSQVYPNITPDQVDAVRKLAVIGWDWNTETYFKGQLRLKLMDDPEGEYRLGETILVAEISPNGAVAMGPKSGGFDYKRKQQKAA